MNNRLNQKHFDQMCDQFMSKTMKHFFSVAIMSNLSL